jgi:hypothetical protein
MLKVPQGKAIDNNELVMAGQLDWAEDENEGSSITYVPVYSPAHNLSGPYKLGDNNPMTASLAACTGQSASSPNTLRTEVVSGDDFTTLYVFTNNLPSHSFTISTSLFEAKKASVITYFCDMLSSPQTRLTNNEFTPFRMR